MTATKPRKRPGRLTRPAGAVLDPEPLARPQEPPPAPSAPLPLGRPAAVSTALLRALRASWARGGPVRALTVALPVVAALGVMWWVIIPAVLVVAGRAVTIASLIAAAGLSVKVVVWALGAPAVKTAAMQLGMLGLVVWLGTLVAASWATYRVTRRVSA